MKYSIAATYAHHWLEEHRPFSAAEARRLVFVKQLVKAGRLGADDRQPSDVTAFGAACWLERRAEGVVIVDDWQRALIRAEELALETGESFAVYRRERVSGDWHYTYAPLAERDQWEDDGYVVVRTVRVRKR